MLWIRKLCCADVKIWWKRDGNKLFLVVRLEEARKKRWAKDEAIAFAAVMTTCIASLSTYRGWTANHRLGSSSRLNGKI